MLSKTPKRRMSRATMARNMNVGYSDLIDLTSSVWAVREAAPATPMNPKVQACAKAMRQILEQNKAQLEKTMRLDYDNLLRTIDTEIQETKQKLELFHQVNEAIHDKCTKRLKRMTDAATEEMEEVQKVHDNICKDIAQLYDKAKLKTIRDFKAEADKLLQSVK
ncbi:hypothetical protein ACHHYP_06941 [Achlya hypogyna]|uniref:Uncharacterized protein n=1 Tax=Achlya hypogyna TaxID=1202772 RepID=A0A1V9ZMX4_ACHHY|nr:hypothetical protein ACHHYP_06941 [Achlya hypogyna]